MAVSLRILIPALFIVSSTGCGYSLPPMHPASQERIRIITTNTDQYNFREDIGTIKQYEVPRDGRVSVDIPEYRRECDIYLFNVVKVRTGDDPLRTWKIALIHNGTVVRELSLLQVQRLAMDQQGYHLLQISK